MKRIRVSNPAQQNPYGPDTRTGLQPNSDESLRVWCGQRRGKWYKNTGILVLSRLQIYIWDLKDPSKPYSPGTRSTKLDEITSLAWNHHVQYALAASSSTGYTVVWDLRGKREVAALAYGGGGGTQAGLQGFGAGLAVGGRRGMSDVAWHPDNVRFYGLFKQRAY